MHYIRVTQVITELSVQPEFLQQLEAEQLIHVKQSLEGEGLLSSEDVDRVRIAKLLMADLEVNLPGVEVVMHMRESMLAMHRQFAEVLDTLVAELRQRLQH